MAETLREQVTSAKANADTLYVASGHVYPEVGIRAEV
jgi:hypothetical protein